MAGVCTTAATAKNESTSAASFPSTVNYTVPECCQIPKTRGLFPPLNGFADKKARPHEICFPVSHSICMQQDVWLQMNRRFKGTVELIGTKGTCRVPPLQQPALTGIMSVIRGCGHNVALYRTPRPLGRTCVCL